MCVIFLCAWEREWDLLTLFHSRLSLLPVIDYLLHRPHFVREPQNHILQMTCQKHKGDSVVAPSIICYKLAITTADMLLLIFSSTFIIYWHWLQLLNLFVGVRLQIEQHLCLSGLTEGDNSVARRGDLINEHVFLWSSSTKTGQHFLPLVLTACLH